MAIYVIADLHLSFSQDKPMSIFGENWEGHSDNDALRAQGLEVKEGRFGSHMRVRLANDGPVTIILDTDELGV